MEAQDSIPIQHPGLGDVLIRRPIECERSVSLRAVTKSVSVLAMPYSSPRFSGVIGGSSRRHTHWGIVVQPTIHLSLSLLNPTSILDFSRMIS